jgi:nitrite reductase/ring-hydroxylating ferredoxin subunit/uncharacterized membrane protein
MTVKQLLQGRPIRHPLHPLTIHLPLGFWLLGLIFDIAALANGGRPETHWMLEAAFWCLLFGTAVSLLSAITGIADWLDIRKDHPAHKTALIHMGLMLPAIAIFLLDTLLHFSYLQQPRSPVLGLVLSSVGYALSIAGGYLGGILVYDDGIGVGRHRRENELPRKTLHADPARSTLDDFEPVAPESSLREGGTLRAEVNGSVIALIKSGDKVFAVQEFCTHRCGPLSEGCVKNRQVQCPWHNSRFDLTTGAVVHGPAKVDLKTFEVRVEGGMIHVRVEREGGAEAARGAPERRNPAEAEKPAREGKRDPASQRPRSELP